MFNMSFSQFLIIKAPSIACWGLAIAFATQATSNYLFVVVSLLLLLLGIHEYNKENEKQEEREKKDKEARDKAEKDKNDKEFVLGIGKGIWNYIKGD